MSQPNEIKKIPIEEVMEYFKNEGIEITAQEAEIIMEFLYSMTMIVIKKYLDPNQDNLNH